MKSKRDKENIDFVKDGYTSEKIIEVIKEVREKYNIDNNEMTENDKKDYQENYKFFIERYPFLSDMAIKKDINDRKLQPEDLYKYLVNANSELFDTPIIGAEVYRSNDGGKKWVKTHNTYLDGVYNTYGYYFGKIHVDPNNSEKIYT